MQQREDAEFPFGSSFQALRHSPLPQTAAAAAAAVVVVVPKEQIME